MAVAVESVLVVLTTQKRVYSTWKEGRTPKIQVQRMKLGNAIKVHVHVHDLY